MDTKNLLSAQTDRASCTEKPSISSRSNLEGERLPVLVTLNYYLFRSLTTFRSVVAALIPHGHPA